MLPLTISTPKFASGNSRNAPLKSDSIPPLPSQATIATVFQRPRLASTDTSRASPPPWRRLRHRSPPVSARSAARRQAGSCGHRAQAQSGNVLRAVAVLQDLAAAASDDAPFQALAAVFDHMRCRVVTVINLAVLDEPLLADNQRGRILAGLAHHTKNDELAR